MRLDIPISGHCMSVLKVLVGCEESGKVREAFRKLGHDAWSCDLLPPRDGSLHHFEGDIFDYINHPDGWDIIILHPPCTALSLSGNRWYGRNMPRHQERIDAISWTMNLWELAKRVAKVGCALENPTSVIWHHLGAQVQYIQPYDFGHGETKKTGLALHNLPSLVATSKVAGRVPRVWKMPPGKNRKRDRSETYQGIADAMAEQWGNA
jgi:hypothetical protein